MGSPACRTPGSTQISNPAQHDPAAGPVSRAAWPGRLELAWPPLVAPALAVIGLSAVFSHWTSAWAFPRFFLAALVLCYFPGAVLLRTLGLTTSGVERLALSLVLGMGSSTVVSWVATALSTRWLVWVWVLTLAVVAARLWRSRLGVPALTRPRIELAHLLLLGVVGAGLLLYAVLPYYWGSFVSLPDGSLRFSDPLDFVLHLSVTSQLTEAVRPDIPYLSGIQLSYHYGMDATGAMLSRASGVGVVDTTVRFDPVLFFTTTALATYSFGRRWLQSRYAAVLAVALVLFAEDFSFVPGLLSGSSEAWTARYFQVPTVFSLFFSNPMLPALGFLMAGLVGAFHYVETSRWQWALVAAFCFALLWEYKVFTAIQVLGALAVAAPIAYWRWRRLDLAYLLGATALCSLPLVLFISLATKAGGEGWFHLGGAGFLSTLLVQIGVLDHGTQALTRVLLTVAVGAPIFLAGSLGMRLFSLPGLLSRRFRLPAPGSLRVLIFVFALLGLFLTLAVSVRPPGGGYDNGIWFYVGSKYVLWFFAVELVVVLWNANRKWLGGGIGCALLALSLPSTVQLVGVLRDLPTSVLPPAQAQMVRAVKKPCSNGAVVLAPLDSLTAILSTTRCETPWADFSFPSSSASLDVYRQRAEDIKSFWASAAKGRCREDLLALYDVELLVVPVSASRRSPCAAVTKRRLFRNGVYTIARITRAARASGPGSSGDSGSKRRTGKRE